MPIHDLLLPEFDSEISKTSKMLLRVPDHLPDFAPHEKSMKVVVLAAHTAQIPMLLSAILGRDALDLASGEVKPLGETTTIGIAEAFDRLATDARLALAEVTDVNLHEPWKLSVGEKIVFSGPRYFAVRNIFFNHMVHHRAQLGIYLRMCNIPVPATYGPSGDES